MVLNTLLPIVLALGLAVPASAAGSSSMPTQVTHDDSGIHSGAWLSLAGALRDNRALHGNDSVITVYTDRDSVSFGDTLTVFIENAGDETLVGVPAFWILDSSRQTVYWFMYAVLLIIPPIWWELEPGEKIEHLWAPVRYPSGGRWLVDELLPGDYYAAGGWWDEGGGFVATDTAEFTLVDTALTITDCRADPDPTWVDKPTDFSVTVSGGAEPYTYDWDLGDGNTSDEAAPTHAYTTADTYSVSLNVTDKLGDVQTCRFNLVVRPTLEITTGALPPGTVGDGFVTVLEAIGGATPYTWEATGLPNGLTCSDDGVISGIPIGEVGEFTVTVTVSDAMTNTHSRELPLTISCKPGDANMDGVVDAGDLTKVRRIFFGIDAPTPCADVNGDGVVNVGDLTAIRMIYFGLMQTDG